MMRGREGDVGVRTRIHARESAQMGWNRKAEGGGRTSAAWTEETKVSESMSEGAIITSGRCRDGMRYNGAVGPRVSRATGNV